MEDKRFKRNRFEGAIQGAIVGHYFFCILGPIFGIIIFLSDSGYWVKNFGEFLSQAIQIYFAMVGYMSFFMFLIPGYKRKKGDN